MTTAILIADITSGASENIAAFVVKGLAVGGGFLVGYFLGAVVAWALDKWVFAQKAPPQLKKMVSLASGVALAILVALIVFGEGGSGLFGSRGNTDGKDKATDDKGKTDPSPQPPTPKKVEEPPPKIVTPVPPSKPADAVIRVTILGGTDVPNNDERYYLIDDDPNRKNLADLETTVAARKEMLKGTVGISIQYRATNKPLQNPEAESITNLRKFAENAKLDVTFPAQK